MANKKDKKKKKKEDVEDKIKARKEKALVGRAIEIKGKKYVKVADRVVYFNEEYPNGKIETYMLSDLGEDLKVFRVKVIPDVEKPERFFTGYAEEMKGSKGVNKKSALENAETSAVGRALAFMGIGVVGEIASANEVQRQMAQEDDNEEKKKDLIEKLSRSIEKADNLGKLIPLRRKLKQSDKYKDEVEKKLLEKINEKIGDMIADTDNVDSLNMAKDIIKDQKGKPDNLEKSFLMSLNVKIGKLEEDEEEEEEDIDVIDEDGNKIKEDKDEDNKEDKKTKGDKESE